MKTAIGSSRNGRSAGKRCGLVRAVLVPAMILLLASTVLAEQTGTGSEPTAVAPPPQAPKEAPAPPSLPPGYSTLPQPPLDIPSAQIVPKKGGMPGELVIAPVPFSNPTFESGLGLGVGYIYKPDRKDKVSPPSIVGVGGLYTENGSWGVGALGKYYLQEDRLRLAGLVAYADVGFKFFGIGQDAGERGLYVDLAEQLDLILLQALRKVRPNTFAGVRFEYIRGEFSVTMPGTHIPDDIPVPTPGFTAQTVGIGLRCQYDTRDNSFAPVKGVYIDLGIDAFDDLWGSDYDYQVLEVALNRYLSLSKNEVLAVRGYGRFTAGDVPFWGMSCFGMHNDLRGYTSGQYRDRHMIATQAEYRRQITRKVGAVFFAGIGAVAPGVDDFNIDDRLTSFGLGVRYRLTPLTPLNYSIDWAYAEGDNSLIFSVGEAF